jgi:hypothetical protein
VGAFLMVIHAGAAKEVWERARGERMAASA